jgi:serine/threonine-protein kinase
MSADRNLLFGILALQMDFITRDALINAMHAWVLDKAKPLGQILQEQRALGVDEHELLDALVAKHLQRHGNDAEKSLASVSSIGSVRQQLQEMADADIQVSLGHVSRACDGDSDPFGTRAGTVGAPTSSGLRFRILRPHAKGGLGQVSVALDEELHREVALKEIQDGYADRADSRARFVLEAEITGGLEHPGIVPVYGLGAYADGRPFYAMRFIRGDSLQDAITRFHKEDVPGRDAGERALAMRQLLGRFIDVCNAVAYAHSRGVLHRDLKPGNVMLGKYGETLVVDWGLAKPLGHADREAESGEGALHPASGSGSTPTQMGTAIGTPAYMSPEQAAGRLDQLGPASDVYSLGATLYFLLAGKPPFDEKDVGVLLQKVQRGEFPPPSQYKSGVPRALEAICLKALALKPESRYLTALQLAADLEHWLGDEPVTAYREPTTDKVRRWVRRHRGLTAGAAGLSLTAVAALAIGLFAVNHERQQTEKALEAETQARTDEAHAREQADGNLRLARDAVDKTVTKIAADPQLKQANFHELRRELLQSMVPFYERFVRQRENDPQLESERGQAWFSLANLRHEMGRNEEARRDYEQTCALFAQLAANFPDVPDYREGLANSQLNFGRLLVDLGKHDEAELAYAESMRIQTQLTADFPTRPKYRNALANSHHNRGILLYGIGKRGEAEAAFRDALRIREQLAVDFPSIVEYQQRLANTQNDFGILLVNRGKRAEAEIAYHEALKIKTRLAQDFPAVPGYRLELARSYDNLASLLGTLGKEVDAEAAHHDALKIVSRLASEFPAVPHYRQQVARISLNHASVLDRLGKPGEAAHVYADALKIQEQLAAEFPAVPQYRRELATTHTNLSKVLNALGKNDDAEAACREGLKIWRQLAADFAVVPDYQLGLGMTLTNLAVLTRLRKEPTQALHLLNEAVPHLKAALQADAHNPDCRNSFRDNRKILSETLLDLGDHAGTVSAADQLVQAAVDAASDVYDAACFFARCVPLAERDTKLSEAERKELAQTYTDRAIATLRQAIQNGYKDVANMKKDTDLDPLRSHPEFKKLLKELEAKAK